MIFGLQVFTGCMQDGDNNHRGLRDLATIWVRETTLKNSFRHPLMRIFRMGVVYTEKSLTSRKHGPKFDCCTVKRANKPFQSTLIRNKRKRISFF